MSAHTRQYGNIIYSIDLSHGSNYSAELIFPDLPGLIHWCEIPMSVFNRLQSH